jgi:type IX secretion system PorP/SprF family membrane protein
MKFTSLIIINCLIVFVSTGQQEYQFANTVNNPYLLNPAAGGLTDVMHFEASTRMQWIGYDGGPKTVLISGNSQIKIGGNNGNALSEFNVKDEKLFKNPEITTSKRKHILGGKIWNDAIGPFTKLSIQGSYAYHLPLTKKMNFGVGLGLGYSNFRINDSKVILNQTNDNTYDQFQGNTATQNLGDAQAGLVVYGKKFFFGISGTQILNNKVELNQIFTTNNFNRHFFIITKYKIETTSDLSVEPSLVMKITEKSPISMDLGARMLYKNSSWFGLQFRTNNSLIFQVGTNLVKNLYVSYAFEQSIGKIRTAGNSTHEIQLGYYLGKNRNVDQELKDKSKESEKL